MGNDFGYDYGAPFIHYDSYGLNRRGWKEISDRAYNHMEEAKNEFHKFVKQHSFKNIESDYKFTKKHAIKMHLVGKLRPKFNRYVAKFGAKAKWVKLTEEEKKATKYKHRVSAIHFCNLTINGSVRQQMLEQEPAAFKEEFLMAEICLFSHLALLGVPEIDALGWIVEVDRKYDAKKVPKIPNLTQFLDQKSKNMEVIHIESTQEYKEDQKGTKKKSKKKQKATVSRAKQLKLFTVTNNRSSDHKKGKAGNPRKRTLPHNTRSDGDDDWTPNKKKRRKTFY